MEKKKHIYIPIEILVREINPKIIFAYYAALNNYRVYLGTKSGIDKIVKKKKLIIKNQGFIFTKVKLLTIENILKILKRPLKSLLY